MKKAFKIIISISFIFYLFALIVILFLQSRGFDWRSSLPLLEYIKTSSNIVPFKTIFTYVTAIFNGRMNIDIPIKNLVINLLLFLPMGIYLPLFIKKINKTSLFSIYAIALLFIVEVVQLLTKRGSFDIDDFILNMVGALIGFAVWKMKVVQRLLK